MKKKYSSPSINVIRIEACNILANSISVNILDSGIGGVDGLGGYDPGASLSRDGVGSNTIWKSGW